MRPDENALLIALHDGPYQQPLWHDFLDRMRLRTGALYVTLLFQPAGEDRIIQLFSGERVSDHVRQIAHAKDVHRTVPYRQMREGRVYAMEEMLDLDDPVHRAFHDNLILPLGITNSRVMRVTEPGGFDAWLSCAGGRGISWAPVGALMTMLAPHLRIALRTFATIERERFRSTVTSEAFQRLDFGWLTLDARCRIVDMTPYMEQLFQRSDVLRRGRYDRLTPASPAIDRELTALVKRFAQDSEARFKAINLSRDPQMDMLVRPVRDRSLSAASPPVAIAYVSGDRWSQADRCEQLIDLFSLSASEARLAWAIAQGMSIAEAAAELGLTVETARNYSKKIYAKTGARGQAELVRTVLTGVLAMA